MQTDLNSPYRLLTKIFETSSVFLTPVVNYLKYNFLTKSEVRWGEETKTAAITFEDEKPVIILNKDFVKSIKNTEDLLFVFIHEVMHYIRGDLFRGDAFKNRDILNLAADILVNRDIYHNVFQFEPEFLWNFLKPEKDPFSLLRMPPWMIDDSGEIYWTGKKRKLFIKAIKNFGKNPHEWISEFAKIYNLLQAGGLTLNELYDFIVRFLGGVKYVFIMISGIPGDRKKIALPFPHTKTWQGKGVLNKQRIKKEKIKLRKVLEISRELREIIYYSGDEYSKIERMIKSSGVLPLPSRKETLLISNDVFPLFYPNSYYTKIMHNEKLHVYLDVSGSMKEELSYIFHFLLSIKDLWGKTLKGFSTELVDLTLENIKKGAFRSTGGTDLNLPLYDAIKNRKKKILIITDLIGRMSRNLITRAKQNNIKIYVLLFHPRFGSPISGREFQNWKKIIEKIWIVKV